MPAHLALATLAMALAGCAGTTLYDCPPRGDAIARVLDAAEARWPDADTASAVSWLDVMCLDETTMTSRSAGCGGLVDACTPWVAGPAGPTLVYVLDGVDPARAIAHEVQHWHLWASGGCASHEAACGWDPSAQGELADAGDACR